jgi:hypothetical protein
MDACTHTPRHELLAELQGMAEAAAIHGFPRTERTAIEAKTRIEAAEQALRDLLDRYTALVNCGDCGNWNPETEPEVIAARRALGKE